MTFTDCSDVRSMYLTPHKKKFLCMKKKKTEEYDTAHGLCSSPQAARQLFGVGESG